jgi:NAD(P)-dependent dehydrogenase (short-subunit alcohol dehydrogenase family)
MSSLTRVVITGANKGIGKATAAAVLAAREDSFVYLGARSEERGKAARQDVIDREPAWADRIEVLPLDVSDESSVKAAAERVASAQGSDPPPLYGLVNNAGIGLGGETMARVLEVNTRGPKRVVDAFLPLIRPEGRIVMVSSASGPMFVSGCREDRRRQLTDPRVTWEDVEAVMKECLALEEAGGDFAEAGFGGGNAYGLSKACLNAYTIALARQHPKMTINACTPGYIATDLTLPRAEGTDPASLGMKPPEEGTRASLHLLFGEPGGSGWYFGSDAQRSPLDRYRSPGDPPYAGD